MNRRETRGRVGGGESILGTVRTPHIRIPGTVPGASLEEEP